MKFRRYVEPPEPMRGLEVPLEVVESLGQGKRPRVTITINGHSWKSRVAIMRGRYLLGLSNANRQACGVSKFGSRREKSRIYRRKASLGNPHRIPCSSCRDGQPLSFSA